MKGVPFDTAIFLIQSGAIYLALSVAVIVLFFFGLRIGVRERLKAPENAAKGSDFFLTSVFGFFAILIAFQLSGATKIYEDTQKILLEEISSISTVVSMSKGLENEERRVVSDLLGQYLDKRLALYDKPLQVTEFKVRVEGVNKVGEALWLKANAYSYNRVAVVMDKEFRTDFVRRVQVMNVAFGNQARSFYVHLPRILWQALVVLLLISAGICGYKMGVEKPPRVFLPLIFLGVMIGAFSICINLGHPRIGVAGYELHDQLLVDLRKQLSLNGR